MNTPLTPAEMAMLVLACIWLLALLVDSAKRLIWWLRIKRKAKT